MFFVSVIDVEGWSVNYRKAAIFHRCRRLQAYASEGLLIVWSAQIGPTFNYTPLILYAPPLVLLLLPVPQHTSGPGDTTRDCRGHVGWRQATVDYHRYIDTMLCILEVFTCNIVGYANVLDE